MRTAVDQLRDERAGAATHVERALSRFDTAEVRHLRGEDGRVAAHEAVVGVGGDVEGHGRQAYAASVIPFIVHATPARQQLGALTIRSDATYQDAIDVYGKPSVCLPRKPWAPFATAVWRTDGFRLKITTLGGLTPGKTFCSDPRHVQIDSAVVTGRRWHTRRGLRIGDSAAKL